MPARSKARTSSSVIGSSVNLRTLARLKIASAMDASLRSASSCADDSAFRTVVRGTDANGRRADNEGRARRARSRMFHVKHPFCLPL